MFFLTHIYPPPGCHPIDQYKSNNELRHLLIAPQGRAVLYDKVLLQMDIRSEEHTSELQSRFDLVCRLLLEKKNIHFCFYCLLIIFCCHFVLFVPSLILSCCRLLFCFLFFSSPFPIFTLSLHDALPILYIHLRVAIPSISINPTTNFATF